MVTVKEQTFNKIQVAELLAYHFKDDERTDYSAILCVVGHMVQDGMLTNGHNML